MLGGGGGKWQAVGDERPGTAGEGRTEGFHGVEVVNVKHEVEVEVEEIIFIRYNVEMWGRWRDVHQVDLH
jgi:hypothetical protein